MRKLSLPALCVCFGLSAAAPSEAALPPSDVLDLDTHSAQLCSSGEDYSYHQDANSPGTTDKIHMYDCKNELSYTYDCGQLGGAMLVTLRRTEPNMKANYNQYERAFTLHCQ